MLIPIFYTLGFFNAGGNSQLDVTLEHIIQANFNNTDHRALNCSGLLRHCHIIVI